VLQIHQEEGKSFAMVQIISYSGVGVDSRAEAGGERGDLRAAADLPR